MRRRNDIGPKFGSFTYQLFLDDVFTPHHNQDPLTDRADIKKQMEESTATCPDLTNSLDEDSSLSSPPRPKTRVNETASHHKINFLSDRSDTEEEDFQKETFKGKQPKGVMVSSATSVEIETFSWGTGQKVKAVRKGFSIWSCLQKKEFNERKRQIPKAYVGAEALRGSLKGRQFKRLAKKLKRLAVDRRSIN